MSSRYITPEDDELLVTEQTELSLLSLVVLPEDSRYPDVPEVFEFPESPCIPLESVGGSGGLPDPVDDSVGGSGGIDPSLGFVEASGAVVDVSDVSDGFMWVYFLIGLVEKRDFVATAE